MARLHPVLIRCRRYAPLALLGLTLPLLGGCMDTILGAIFAPQAVAANAAAGSAQAVSSSVPNSAVPIPDGDQAESAAGDLQRVIDSDPDAANRPELVALRNQLINSPSTIRRLNAVTEEPDRKAAWDHRVRAPRSFQGDDIGVDLPPPLRRAGQEWALPTTPGEMVTPEPVPTYQLSLEPVRLH